MAIPRIIVVRRVRRISRLLAWLLAPFVGSLAGSLALAQQTPAPNALPQGGQVKVGAGQITQVGKLLLIQQSTPRLGLDWQRFDIGSDATVEFRQPGASSVALNRVIGPDPSAIFGRLISNGQVFLANPNGVLFAPGAKVDVGGLVASTLDLSQNDFAAGKFHFSGQGATVLNQGQIDAGGYVALFGGTVANEGEISVPAGTVVLASGRAATVSLSDGGLLSAVMTPGDTGAVINSGRIAADGGSVRLSAASAEGIASSLVNNSGLVRANSIVERSGEILITGDAVATSGQLQADGRGGASGGRIVVLGDMRHGSAQIGGEISAQALDVGGTGGQVETSAAHVQIAEGTRVATLAADGRHGQWVIDPTDFVVGAGSAAQTSSGIGASTLATNLQSGNVTLLTADTGSENGDIRIEAPVSWSASTTLTLSAIADIEVNANITATGNAAGLTLSAGSGRYTLADGASISLPGSSPSLSINGEAFIVINSLTALQAINTDGTTLGRNYALGSDVDASATATWNDGAGFQPIGHSSAFSGDFDGLGHRITGLTVNRPDSDYAGLFGYSNGGHFRHLELSGGSVVGGTYVGALVGYHYQYNASVGAAVEGVRSDLPVTALLTTGSTAYAGGLIGSSTYGRGIHNSHATGAVLADANYGYLGGLVGQIYYSDGISDSSASGQVKLVSTGYSTVDGNVGGLVGYAYDTPMDKVSAAGAVSGGDYAGGLVGQLSQSPISQGHASGDVSGADSSVGGLVAYASGSPMDKVSATGQVQAPATYVGGLVGQLQSSALSNASASGVVSGTSSNSYYVGGLVAYANSSAMSAVAATGNVVTDNNASGYVGGLVGIFYNASITGGSATGAVTGGIRTGGLVGYGQLDAGNSISDSWASGKVEGNGIAGGLVGELQAYNYTDTPQLMLSHSHASGEVRGNNYTGGLIGRLFTVGAQIEDVYATGRVTAGARVDPYVYQYAGGLVGYLEDYGAYYSYYYDYAPSTIRRSFASGDVVLSEGFVGQQAQAYAGGLIGFVNSYYYNYGNPEDEIVIADSYASGRVNLAAGSGSAIAGGLVGYNVEGHLLRTYASGAVSVSGLSGSTLGGLVGQHNNNDGVADIVDSYWNTTTTGQATSSGGGTGLSDTAMKQAASFATWDIATTAGAGRTWRLYEGLSQPLLTGFLTPLTLTLANQTRVYDGSTGLVVGDGQILVAGVSPDVGSTTITAASLYSSQTGYDLDASGSATLTITQRPITWDGAIAPKVYDGNAEAFFVADPQLTGLVAGESLVLNLSGATASFDDKNAGVGKAVTVGGVGLGSTTTGKPSNYTLSPTTTADVTPRPVNAGGFATTDRAYDGSTAVAVTFTPAGAITGTVAGDSLSLNNTGATGAMADRHAGADKAVIVSGVSLAGADAANYRLAGVDDVTVTVSPKLLTATGVTAFDRTYDSSTNVSINASAGAVTGVVDGDLAVYAVRSPTGSMADRHAGLDKAVTVSGLTLVGPEAANYSVQATGLTVDIAPRSVTGYVYQVYNSAAGGYGYKIYDGSADASAVASVDLSNDYSIDDLTFTWTGIGFADKNVAYDGSGNVTDRIITATGFAISGENAGNYVLSNTSNTTTGRILPRALTVSGVSAVDRVYDGTVNVQVSISGAAVDEDLVVGGDDVSISVPGGGSVSGSVANKNAGVGKAVTVPGLVLAGTDAGNYTLSGANGVTVDIARKDLTTQYTGQDKTYDGTTSALVTAASSDVVAGDDVQFYTNLYGNSYCQYAYNYCYANYTGDGAKNVGTDKPISISYEYLYGNDAGNYNLLNASSGTATGNVLARAITPSVTGVDKVYDGSTVASVTLNGSASGIVSGDSVDLGTQNAVFSSGKNVGTGKAVAVSNITLAGTDAGNYSLAANSANTTADITAKPVSVSGITAVDRIYDGTTVVQVQAGTPVVQGLVAGDDVQAVLPISGITSGTMADRHTGSDKPVAVTGLSLAGDDAGNYALTSSGGTVNIAPKPITAAYTGEDKVYDGGVSALVIGSSAGIVQGVGDSVAFSQTAVFSGSGARNAGTDKPIDISDISLYGAQAGNYVLQSTSASTTGDITPKSISASYIGISRVYNGTEDLSATVIGSASGLVAGDSVGLNQTARFATDGNAGSNKTVNVSDISLAGVNAGNYALTTTAATTTANITPRLLGVAGMAAVNRVYDGTTTVQVNVSGAEVDLTGVLGDDEVTVSLPAQGITSGEMLDKHVGENKSVSVSGLLIGGADAANYALTGEGALTVDISALGISVVFSGLDKVYDGAVTASVLGSSSGFAVGDSVGVAASAIYTGTSAKNVGNDKAVSVSNAYLTGDDRFNYVLLNRDGSTTADITPRTLTAQYSGGSRAYDGTVVAPVNVVLANLVSGDVVSLSQTAVFTGAGAKNVGDAKPIAVDDVEMAGADAGNYVLAATSASTSGSITPRLIVVEGVSGMTAAPRAYDGTTLVSVTVPTGISGTPRDGDVLDGEQVIVQVPSAGTTTGTMADRHAGLAKPVLVTGLGLSGADAGNYAIASASGVTVDISQLSISAVYSGIDKVYDGSADASVDVALQGVIGGDSLSGSASGVFSAGKNAGLDKAIVVSGAVLSGLDAGNYSLSNPGGSTSADIDPRSVTAVYAGGSKVYDGSTSAPVTGSLSGLIAGDAVDLSQTAVFSGGKNVGVNKQIAVSGIALDGSDAANYQLDNGTAVTTGSVTPRPVVIDGLTVSAQGREYDGSTQVVVQVQASAGAGVRPGDVIAGDDVTVNVPPAGETTGTMADKHAGLAKPISVTGLSLDGADAGNYLITGADGLTVDITPRALSASWVGVDKVYDGTNIASALGSADGLVAGDVLTLTASGIFSAGKNVGTDLAIELQSALLGGADAGNYSLSNPSGSTTASITPLTLAVSYTGLSRVYDGGVLAPVEGALSGVIAGDTVGLSQSAVFNDGKNVGSAKPVSVTGIALTGADAGNYRSDLAATGTTASVTPRPIVIDGLSGNAVSREYDGTTTVAVELLAAAGVGPRAGDLIAGDEVSVSVPAPGQTAGTMADKHVGIGKAVVIDGLLLSGADAGNYFIEGVDGVTADVTPRVLTAVFTGVDKVYDGSNVASALGTAAGIVGGDLLTITGSGSFSAGKNVGNGLVIELQSALLAGADAGNYTLSNPTGSPGADITANITPRTLTALYTGIDKVYDGGTAAQVTASLDGLIDGDLLTLSQSAIFTGGKNVGVGKAVLVAGISLDGADAGNYVLAANEADSTASITPRLLSVTGLSGLSAVDRSYDGTLDVQLTGTASGTGGLDGAIAGDDVQLSQGGAAPSAGSMADKHVGTGKAVVVDGLFLSGDDAANYMLGGVVGLTVDITPLAVALSGLTAVNRVYDGSLAVAIDTSGGSIAGVLAGDDLSLLASGVSGSMADKTAGNGKAVMLDGVAFGGADAGNYTVLADGLTVDIARRLLTIGGTAQDKVYDGNSNAGVVTTDDRVTGDVLTITRQAARFADANAGSGKAVSVSGLGLSGADAANYSLGASALALLADIERKALTVVVRDHSKVYGQTQGFAGSEFEHGEMAAGESLSSVSLGSSGAGAGANVGVYAITASGAQGPGFNPANYELSYVDGRLAVTPRPLTVASNTLVRYVGDPNPTDWAFSTGQGGLVNGDSLQSVVQLAPPGSDTTTAAQVYSLLPSGAVFGSGLAADYDISYTAGLLIVLPRPPSVDDADGGTTGGNDPQFAVIVSPEEVAAAVQALQRSAAAVRAAEIGAAPGPDPRATGSEDPAEVLAALLRGETQRISLATLLRLPMISVDPTLRRLLAAAAGPATP